MLLKLIKKSLARAMSFSILIKVRKKILSRLVVLTINSFKIKDAHFTHFDLFEYWQKNGFFILPNNFYQPVPDTSLINIKKLEKVQSLDGININETKQLSLLQNFSKFKDEYLKIPYIGESQGHIFYFNNLAFDGVDALVYYCMIRHFNPKNIIEVGSGWSTKIAAQAVLQNRQGELVSIEPYPQPFMQNLFPGLSKVIAKKVEENDISIFEQLKENDILFIDSSHTVKTGGDVNYLFLEVLPRLKKGVIIHIHDIFFPFDYPKDWILKEHRLWAEQYLLQAFLMFNDTFEVIYSNSFMGYKHSKKVKNIFSNSPFYKGGSIWIQKIR
ncbi:MAG: class I SAM-dependent methyltransferase [Candidatus Daviesbacteria bacterium]|nr:class I SAM-dependent methyltransferase [Candidatus Daviesbacteria bacterium]